MKTLWHLARAQWHWGWLLPPAVLAVMLLHLFLYHNPAWGAMRRPADLLSIFEGFLPLAAAFYLAGLPVLDREAGTAEIHLSYPQWPAIRMLLTAVAPVAAWAAASGAAVVVVQVWYLQGQAGMLANAVLPPAVALTGGALALSALTRYPLGGMLGATIWWLMDLTLPPGRLNGKFYLFRLSRPTPLMDQALQNRNLLLAGALLWLFALWLAHRRSHWIR